MRSIEEIIQEFEKRFTQEPTSQQLTQEWISSPLYSHRYIAGEKLGKDSLTVAITVDGWIPLLQDGISATKLEPQGCGEWYESPYQGDGRHPDGGYTQSYDIQVPDPETRIKNLKDLSDLLVLLRQRDLPSRHKELQSIIRKTYCNNDSPETQKEAGRQLGYCALRIYMTTERLYEPIIGGIVGLMILGMFFRLSNGYVQNIHKTNQEEIRIEREKELAPHYPPGYFKQQKTQ